MEKKLFIVEANFWAPHTGPFHIIATTPEEAVKILLDNAKIIKDIEIISVQLADDTPEPPPLEDTDDEPTVH